MKKYYVRKYAQSPFNADDLGVDALILCDVETDEPVAEIETEWVMEGDTFTQDETTLKTCSKRLKHLVVGDRVIFGFFEGKIHKIESLIEGEFSYYDKVYVTDCKKQEGLPDSIRKNIIYPEKDMVLTLNDVKHKDYLVAYIRLSLEKHWEVVINKFTKLPDYELNTIIDFFKKNTQPKNYEE